MNSQQIEFLKENYNKMTIAELARELGLGYFQVYSTLQKLGIHKKGYKPQKKDKRRKNRVWSDEEIKFLKSNFGKMKAQEIAIRLNRTYWDVIAKARALKLSKTKRKGKMPKYLLPLMSQ